MKTRSFILILFCSLLVTKALSDDTLSIYDQGSVNTLYYNSQTYTKQLARFDLPKPATLKGFVLTLNGNANATLKLSVYGHEGGVMLPDLFNAFRDPITVTKQTDGFEKLYVELSEALYLANNQFFVLFEDISDQIQILSDRNNHTLSCQSSSGGTFYYQFLYNGSEETWYLSPGGVNRAFAIDVILEYNQDNKPIFKDITTDANISDNLSNTSIAAADYNQDGAPDLLIKGKLYENQKDGTFSDVTDAKGVINTYSSVTANAFVDMDNDGDLDIILFGPDTSMLFVNGNGSFSSHVLNLPKFNAFLSFSFADINFDGFPDLFVSQLWQTYPEAEPNYFFYNDKNLGFTDATSAIYPKWDGTWNYPDGQWYVDHTNQQYVIEKNRNSRGSQWVDFDNDGDMDLYVVNYFLHKDEFYENNGDGTFTDIAQSKEIDVTNPGTAQEGANHGTGVDWYDYDNDGDMDLLLPQFAHPRFIEPYDHRGTTIYRNDGAPDYDFTDMVGQYNDYKGLKSSIGLELEETHAGGAWGDVNNDGLADFLMTVFYGCRYIDLYEQQPDHSFELKTYEYGLEGINTGNDIVWLDYNSDGRLDLAGAEGGKFRLLVHDVWSDKKFLGLNLHCTTGNKYAIGAKVIVYANGEKYTQEVNAGRGQKMQKPFRLHFGLDKAQTIDSVVVLWPVDPQKRESFTGMQVNEFYNITEGQGAVVSTDDPDRYFSLKIHPNPVHDLMYIDFYLTKYSLVDIELLNTLGQKINKLAHSDFSSGRHTLTWPKDNDLPPGVYFVKFSTGQTQRLYKIMLSE